MVETSNAAAAPYDALLLLSFGGPEGPEEVVPFLENVTRGRGIPKERLAAVGEHYFLFGGVSPINAQCRAQIAEIERDLAANGVDVPVYWGNRNWTPYLADTLKQMAADGVRRALVFVTSAYSSYSGCRQYREDLAAAVEQAGVADVLSLDKIRAYFDHPGFVEPFAEATIAAFEELDESVRDRAELVFVTHSVPLSYAETSAYVPQHEAVAQLVSDHMEVIYDLDTQAAEVAEKLGLPMARAATPGTAPAFVALVRGLLTERAAAERGERVERAGLSALGPMPDVCAAGCCPNPRVQGKPALCGRD